MLTFITATALGGGIFTVDNECACIPGPLPAAVSEDLASGNNATVGMLTSVRESYKHSSTCFRNMWRETFLLSASWEGSHIAFGRYSRQPSLENYFVFPTYCQGSSCVNNHIDWVKNSLWDAVFLYVVGMIDRGIGVKNPEQWFWLEQLLGNLEACRGRAEQRDRLDVLYDFV